MSMDEDELVLPDMYSFTPLRALRVASLRKLSGFLDLEGALVVFNNDGTDCDVLNDYSGLAELAGFSYQDIMNIKGKKSPTTELLDMWIGQNGTVGKLWMYLYKMERFDVLTDCRRLIVQDCLKYEECQQLKLDAERYNIEQDPGDIFVRRSSIVQIAETLYDAFICYTEEDENDRKFLYKMIEELEFKRGLKLFVPGRDDLPGSTEYTITAYLIEKRCTRVVILMSRKFLQSAAFDFQVKFAHALSPGARNKKFIPVSREENTQMPSVLRFLAVCDFTKSVKWTWDRLFTAIISPVGRTTYFEEENPSTPSDLSDECLIDIKFPSYRRLDEHKDTTGHQNGQSETGSRLIYVSACSQPRVPKEYDVTSMPWGQPTTNMQSQSPSSLKCSSLPKEATGQASSQRQQPSTHSGTISSS